MPPAPLGAAASHRRSSHFGALLLEIAVVVMLGCGGGDGGDAGSRVSITLTPSESGSDTVPSVSFKICNQGYQPVRRVVFSARTRATGASAMEPMVLGGGANELAADLDLPQARCADHTWEGSFLVLDSVEVRIVEVIGGGA